MSVCKIEGKHEKLSETKSKIAGYEFVYEGNWSEFVEDISKLSIESAKAEAPPAGEYAAVLDPKAVGLLLHESLGHASEGDLASSGNSILYDKLGEKIADESVNIVDKGFAEGGVFVPYDDEGIKKMETRVVENGVLRTFLHTRETAKKCNALPTGNARAESSLRLPIARQTNYFLVEGDMSFEELIEDVTFGIYIRGIGSKGGQANASLGTFTFSAGPSYIIRNGEVCEMVRGVNIGGSILEVLRNVEGIGNDVRLHFNIFLGCKKEEQTVKVGFGGPHIKLRKVIIGGEHKRNM
jgi:TldD protein